MKLLTTMIHSFKCERAVLLTLLFAATQGNTETECEATEGMILKCKFPINMKSTKTDFFIYFYPDGGRTELLADCSWNNNQPLCIFQDGIQLKQPVSDITVISLPPRLVSMPGTYKCIPDGANSENSKACQIRKSQKELEESQDKSENGVHQQNPVEILRENHHDQEGAEMITPSIIGAVLGSVAFIVIVVVLVLVLYNKFRKKDILTSKASSLGSEKLSEFAENSTTDTDADVSLSSGSQSVPSQQASSAAEHEEVNPLLQSDNNEKVAIREHASNEEDSDTFRCSLELNDRSCEGFLRERF